MHLVHIHQAVLVDPHQIGEGDHGRFIHLKHALHPGAVVSLALDVAGEAAFRGNVGGRCHFVHPIGGATGEGLPRNGNIRQGDVFRIGQGGDDVIGHLGLRLWVHGEVGVALQFFAVLGNDDGEKLPGIQGRFGVFVGIVAQGLGFAIGNHHPHPTASGGGQGRGIAGLGGLQVKPQGGLAAGGH